MNRRFIDILHDLIHLEVKMKIAISAQDYSVLPALNIEFCNLNSELEVTMRERHIL